MSTYLKGCVSSVSRISPWRAKGNCQRRSHSRDGREGHRGLLTYLPPKVWNGSGAFHKTRRKRGVGESGMLKIWLAVATIVLTGVTHASGQQFVRAKYRHELSCTRLVGDSDGHYHILSQVLSPDPTSPPAVRVSGRGDNVLGKSIHSDLGIGRQEVEKYVHRQPPRNG